MRKPNHIIQITVGDKCNDGHGRRDTFLIECSGTEEDLEKAYRKGSKVIGFDLVKDVARYHEDSKLEIHLIQELIAAKVFSMSDLEDPFISGDCVDLGTSDMLKLYMAISTLGNDKLKWRMLKAPSLHIGGYGCFKD